MPIYRDMPGTRGDEEDVRGERERIRIRVSTLAVHPMQDTARHDPRSPRRVNCPARGTSSAARRATLHGPEDARIVYTRWWCLTGGGRIVRATAWPAYAGLLHINAMRETRVRASFSPFARSERRSGPSGSPLYPPFFLSSFSPCSLVLFWRRALSARSSRSLLVRVLLARLGLGPFSLPLSERTDARVERGRGRESLAHADCAIWG